MQLLAGMSLTAHAYFQNHLTLRAVKDKLQAADRDYIWSLVSSRENLAALSRDISWMRLWDEAREQGIRGARAIATVLRVITIPVFTDDFVCPVFTSAANSSTCCTFSQLLPRKPLKRHYHLEQYCTQLYSKLLYHVTS